jgi:Rad3-related DNA helicase
MLQVEMPQIGPYTPIRLLGEGSTMSTYLYRHEQRKKYAVIKVTRTPLATLADKEAFLMRAKSLKKLKHRNIIEVQDYSMLQAGNPADDFGYLVMQYTQGSNIRTRFIEGQCYPPDEVKRVLSLLADALHYAHVMNVTHGNLHPGNILQGEVNNFLLTDFSFEIASQDLPENTKIAAYLYRAPEQTRGSATAASDQYALATMVYECLCGQRPYQAIEQEELLFQQEHEPIPPPSSLNPRISPLIEQTLLRALAVNPAERFPHTLTFADTYLRALMGFSLPAQVSSSPALTGHREQQPITANAPQPAIETPQQTRPQPTSSALNKTTISQSEASKPSLSPSSEQVREEIYARTSHEMVTTTPLVIQNGQKPAEAPEQAQKKKPEESAKQSKLLFYRDSADLQRRVDTDLRQGGVLSNSLPGYEERPAQIDMATLVARSLTESIPSIIEASTGTGKSLAYLIPVVRSGKVAIISTANKALQEQLFYKDIPFVQKYIRYFDAALVKGMGNYICLDRMEQERTGFQYYVKNPDFLRLLRKIAEEEENEYFPGDFETLGFTLPADVRSKVNADRDQCSWSKCSYYSKCYVHKMKVKAGRAKVIVVNHTLLLLDALMEGYLLPERDVIIVDEAHHLEEEATRAFTVTISQGQITTLLAQHMLKDHTPASLQEETKETMIRTWERLYDVADPGYKGRANLKEPLQEGLGLASVVTKLADALYTERPKDLPEKDEQLYDKLLSRAQNLAEDIRTVFSVDQPEKRVYYVERVNTSGKRGLQQLEISAAPLEVTSWLREELFDKSNVICTSATLATIGPDPAKPEVKGSNFAYFRRRVGLDPTNYPNIQECILPLTFDYGSQALLYLPRHLPEPAYGTGPAAQEYIKAIGREMIKLVEASRGRAFLLFSSKRMLDEVYGIFQTELPIHLKFPLLRQGDSTRLELVRSFRERQGSVLFGLKSFWEGVDIAGEALSLVVIDKLPFDPPDDPVHEARVAQMKAAGENWFGTYVLPQTVLRLKQGLGRLLRTHDDRGVMAILDTRLYTKGYGKQIVLALPPARRTANLSSVTQFFSIAEDEEEAPF